MLKLQLHLIRKQSNSFCSRACSVKLHRAGRHLLDCLLYFCARPSCVDTHHRTRSPLSLDPRVLGFRRFSAPPSRLGSLLGAPHHICVVRATRRDVRASFIASGGGVSGQITGSDASVTGTAPIQVKLSTQQICAL